MVIIWHLPRISYKIFLNFSWDFLPTSLCFMWNRAFLFIRDMFWACPPHRVHPYSIYPFSQKLLISGKDNCFFRGLSCLIFTIVTISWILFQDYFSQQNGNRILSHGEGSCAGGPYREQASLGCGRWAVSHLLTSLVTCSCPYISHRALSQPFYSVPQQN